MKVINKFYGIILAFGLLMLCGIFCLFQHFFIPSQVNDKIDEAREVAYFLQKTYPLLEDNEQQDFINDIMTWEKGLSYVLFMDKNGKALVHSEPERQGMVFNDEGTLAAARDQKVIQQIYTRDESHPRSSVSGEQVIDILVPAYDNKGNHIGAINVGIGLKQLESLREKNNLWLGIYASILILFLILTTTLFNREVVKPIKQIIAAIREVKEGNYRGVKAIKTKNELGLVAAEFNSMSGTICRLMGESKKRENELQEYIDQLITLNGKIAPDGSVLMINEQLLEKLNITKEELIGTYLWDLPCWFFDERGKKYIKSSIISALNGAVVFQQLTRGNHKGDSFFLEISINPVFNHDMQVEYLVFEGRDITAQKRAEKAIHQANEELEMRVNLRTAELKDINEELQNQIDERQRIELALRESEANLTHKVNYLNILIDSLNEMFYTYTPDGVINFVNRKSSELLQHEPQEMMGHRVTDFVAEEYRPQRELEVYKCLYMGKESTFETVLVCKDGTHKAVRINASPIIEDGDVVGAMSLAEDITERKQSEEALRKSEDRFSKAFHSSPVIMFISSFQDNCFIDVNESFVQLTGYSWEYLIGRRIEEIGDWEDGKILRNMLLVNNGVLRDQVTIFTNGLGEERWLKFSTELIELKDERCVLAVIIDITERKRAVEALAAEKERLAVTLSSIGDGVIATDFEGNIALTNEASCKVLGMNQEELEGNDFRKVLQLFPLEHKVINRIADGQAVYEINNHVIEDKDGRQRLIEAKGSPIRNERGKFWGLVWVLRDITEKQRIEDEMIKASKLESLGVLAGGLAHDFNNLLTVIAGNISLSQIMAEGNREVCGLLHEAEKAACQAKGLTQQLLTFARGGAPIKKTYCIAKLLQDSVNFALSGAHIASEFHIPDNLWNVEVDEGQISQVINNLIINAIQAMPHGGSIKIIAENINIKNWGSDILLEKGKYVKITIADEGEGIPEKYQSNIFDPYFTSKEKGTGLGLATAYSIINRHGGNITFDSKPSGGTSFYIYLPAVDDEKATCKHEDKKVVKGKGRILVMDDEVNVRKVVKEMIGSLGYEVELTGDGEECINLYEKSLLAGDPFKTIIMDLTIPGGMGGKETVQKLLKIDPNVKVIVSSGYSNDPVMSEYQKWGFKGIIDKPYGITELSNVLQEVIESS
ncbi:MAG: PAS domain S-box protein [Syntrophomonadaceae bacterium]|nr:PAS domain S-box protein [Syntrophomonadaceae bacterium]